MFMFLYEFVTCLTGPHFIKHDKLYNQSKLLCYMQKTGFSIYAQYILKRNILVWMLWFLQWEKNQSFQIYLCNIFCSSRNAMYWQKVIELVILQNACIAKRGSDVILIKRKGWEGGKLIYTLSLSWPPTCTRINTNTKHKDKDTKTKLKNLSSLPPFPDFPHESARAPAQTLRSDRPLLY